MTFVQHFFLLVIATTTSFFVTTSLAQETLPVSKSSFVTIANYTDFLNCVAKTDTYGLYNDKMGDDEGMRPIIIRSGNPGSYIYTYDFKKDSPVTYVSKISAMRYCNWKSNHGAVGLQDSTTTETGSYDLTAFDQGADISTVILAPGARFFLPTNYLVDAIIFQNNSSQSCDPYFTSSRLGFCIGTWTSDSLSDAADGTKHTDSSGNAAGSPSGSNSEVRDGTIVSPASDTSKFISLASSTNTNTNTNQIQISRVVVDAPNNSADFPSGTNQPGYGFVLMPYQIGTFDVTADEYCSFLNAIAKKSDPHRLYNTNMTSDPDIACIIRSGDTNSGYTYTPMNGREKFPITYVSWYSATRFCNWLENGQPIGDQTAATTEAGAFGESGAEMGKPTPGAVWSLPTENQWYKAAYYISSTNNTPGKYCAFGTASMDAPGNKWEEAAVANRANYSLNGIPTKQDQPRLTPVGYFTASASPWGAYDMAGELHQWTSTFDASGNNVIIRGGSWKSQTSDDLKSTARFTNPGIGNSTIGFRVVYNIPPAQTISHIEIERIPIGDPNNHADTSDAPGGKGFGKVTTGYYIGKYDVTAEQYCMFLNAVAAHDDPHRLYNTNMGSDADVACIVRYGNTNVGYSYFTIPGREKLPITYVNWFSTLRFCNWLENNQPIGDESPETTESGSFNHDDEGVFRMATNNPKWLLPNEDQWYKAAYYSPGKDGGVSSYYSFGTASYQPPVNSLQVMTNSANYCLENMFTTTNQPRLTPVGTFTQSASPLGAYDMAGEVSQWTLTPLANTNQIVVRGGSWQSTNYFDLKYSKAFFINPNESSSTVGFRLVYNVPPPPPTTFDKIANGLTVVGKDIKEDLTGIAHLEMFKEPGTYFFRVMYYSIGAGISELAATSVNYLVYALKWIFTTIADWIKYCFGDAVFSWFNGWIKYIYDFLFSPIVSQRLAALSANRIRSQVGRSALESQVGGLIRQAVASGTLSSEATSRLFESSLSTVGQSENALVVASNLSEVPLADIGQAIGYLRNATTIYEGAVAAEASQAALVAFFASPAAAIIIPALLVFGSYEVLIATTSPDASSENDSRITAGLIVDTAARYLWSAIKLIW